MNIQFTTYNAAFADDFSGELLQIFNRIITQVENGTTDGLIFDSNGNKVGHWEKGPKP